jgi:hypothetical protein
VVDQAGKEHIFRRCRIILKKETRDGDKEIAIITNLPKDAASAIIISNVRLGFCLLHVLKNRKKN